MVLTDVAPYTLGIEVHDGHSGGPDDGRMLPVIERNTVIPVSRMEEVRPAGDFQRQVRVRVFQGEARRTRDNIALGSFELALSPQRVRDQPIEVRFTYDVNGIIEVSAKAQADGASERIVIRHGPDAPSPEIAEERMAALVRVEAAPSGTRAAKAVALARAERLFEALLGEAREALGRGHRRFRGGVGDAGPGTRGARRRRTSSTMMRQLERTGMNGARVTIGPRLGDTALPATRRRSAGPIASA